MEEVRAKYELLEHRSQSSELTPQIPVLLHSREHDAALSAACTRVGRARRCLVDDAFAARAIYSRTLHAHRHR